MAEHYLDGVEFPTTKLELIEIAEHAGAPQEAVERLQRLSREQYGSRDELEAELDPDA